MIWFYRSVRRPGIQYGVQSMGPDVLQRPFWYLTEPKCNQTTHAPQRNSRKSMYSNFRNYAPPPDGKRGIITEKVFPVFSESFFGAYQFHQASLFPQRKVQKVLNLHPDMITKRRWWGPLSLCASQKSIFLTQSSSPAGSLLVNSTLFFYASTLWGLEIL